MVRSQRRFALLAIGGLTAAIILMLGTLDAVRADSMSLVTSTGAQQPNDSVAWSQLGSNATVLAPSFSATSANGIGVSISLTGSNSLLSVVCPASSCNWSGNGMASGDSLIWTNNGANGGNGPLSINFSRAQAGAGAFIQSDGPSTFIAKIEAFSSNGASLGSFTQTSDSSGHAIYIGILDRSGANISSVVFSLTQAQGSLADFALDRVYLNNAVVLGSQPTPVPTVVQPTRTATPTATPTALSTSAAGSVAFVGSSSSTSTTLTVPSGVQNGDLLLAFYSYWSSANASGPSGWTLLHTSTALGSGVESVWYRFASNDVAGAAYTWTFTGTPYEAGGMLAYRGANPGTFEDGLCLNEGKSSTPNLCSFTTGNAGDTYVAFFATENTNLALPGDLTARVTNQYASGSHFGVAAANKNLGAAGFISTDTGSMNSGGWATVAFAIKPKSGSATPTTGGATPTSVPTSAPPPTPPPPTRTATITATVVATPIPASVTFIGSSTTSSTNQTVPSNVQNGDLLLAFFSYWSNATASAPSGWTLLHSSISLGSGVETVWYRFASNDAGSVYTWTFNGTPFEAGGMLAYRGVAASFEDGSCLTSGHSTAPALCSFSTTSSNDTYVGLFAAENLNMTLPTDLTARQITPYLAGSHFGVSAGTKSLGAPGPVPADSGFMNNGGWASIAFALRPSSTGGPVPTSVPTTQPTTQQPTHTPTAAPTAGSSAISLVGTTSSTSTKLTIPNGVQNGDLLLAVYSYWSTTTVTGPSGWTLLHTVAAPGNAQAAVWYRFANGDASGAPYTWTFSGGAAFEAGGILAYRGVSAISFDDGYCTTEGVSSSPGLCSFTANFSHDMYVAIFATGNSNLVLPSDLTGLVTNQYVAGTHFGIVTANKALGASGIIPADTGFMSAGGWASIAVALRANGAVP